MSITVSDLSHTFDTGTAFETCALSNVTMTIKSSKITGIMGMTGCGKSTLIQMISGLYVPQKGQIMIDGEDINDPSYDRFALRRKLGIVFQYPENQLFETTAYKDVAFGLKHSGMTDEEKDRNIRWAFEVTGFDFDAVAGESPLGLSGGEKRRLVIAGVLAVKPKYLILDEPVAGLDPIGRTRFMHLIRKLNKDGMTIIMVSHNADAIAECTDSLFIMRNGSILCSGNTREIFADADMVRSCGIDVSRPRHIAEMLADKGADISSNLITYDDLLPELIRIMERKNR